MSDGYPIARLESTSEHPFYVVLSSVRGNAVHLGVAMTLALNTPGTPAVVIAPESALTSLNGQETIGDQWIDLAKVIHQCEQHTSTHLIVWRRSFRNTGKMLSALESTLAAVFDYAHEADAGDLTIYAFRAYGKGAAVRGRYEPATSARGRRMTLQVHGLGEDMRHCTPAAGFKK